MNVIVHFVAPTASFSMSWTQIALAVGAIAAPIIALIGVIVTGANAWRQTNKALQATQAQIAAAAAATQNQLDAAAATNSAQLAAAAKNNAAQLDGSAKNVDRQIRATVVSTNRQRWIDALRDDVAEFLTKHENVRVCETASGMNDNERARAQELVERRELLARRIQLRLNPDEPEHKQFLFDLLALKSSKIPFHMDPLVDRVTDEMQLILKGEWGRVKRGD